MKREEKIPQFGDRVTIEQKRYGVENEQYSHKVIGALRSNTWVDVPVQTPAKEIIHEDIVDVVRCICEGVEEVDVFKYRVEDVEIIKNLTK